MIASNGVIHVIDSVLIPEDLSDIVDTAVNAGIFNTLVAAVQAAGLEETLRGDDLLTVFAPTDEAFGSLPPELVNSLLLEENVDVLTAILTYHAVAGKVISSEVVNIDSAATVNGANLTIEVVDGMVKVDNATVTTVDVDASNGVIHIIDAVLIPDNIELPVIDPTPTPTPTAVIVDPVSYTHLRAHET